MLRQCTAVLQSAYGSLKADWKIKKQCTVHWAHVSSVIIQILFNALKLTLFTHS